MRVNKLAVSPNLEAGANRRLPVYQVPARDRDFIIVVVDLMRGEHVTLSAKEIYAV